MIELLLLRGVQVFLAGFEIGAGINHVAVEPEPVEIIGYVIVITHRSGIAACRMTVSAQQSCQKTKWWRSADPLGERNPYLKDLLKPTVDIDFAFYISAGEPPDVAGHKVAK